MGKHSRLTDRINNIASAPVKGIMSCWRNKGNGNKCSINEEINSGLWVTANPRKENLHEMGLV